MRYEEFDSKQFPKVLEDIQGVQNYALYLDLVEAEIVGTPLNEELDKRQIETLERLQKLSVSYADPGNVYDYVFLMLDANSRLHVLGHGQQVILDRVNRNEYKFSDGKTYPDQRWSKLSYAQLYIFDDTAKYQKFKTFLRLKFDVLVESNVLAERSQQRTQVMYHGTSTKLVPSILKNGLLANPPKKTYDVDTYGAATASMGGVYVADNKDFASTIAREAVETHGGEPALVTLQYVKGSADIDEDDLVAAISDAASKVMRNLSQKDPNKTPDWLPRDFGIDNNQPKSKYSGLSYPSEGWATDQMITKADSAATKIAAETVQVLSKYAKPSQAAQPIIKQMALKLLQHAGTFEDVRDRWNAIRYDAYEIVREQMEELLAKLMRQVSPDTPTKSAGARRIDRDVKFKGKTRILKIESPIGKVVYTAQPGTESIDEDILDEQPVLSSWIADITLANDGSVTITLGNNRRYSVKSVGDQIYQAWIAAPSKGKFWHQQIKNNHAVVRLM